MNASEPSILSLRGRRLLDSQPATEYISEHFARLDTPFDPTTRPDGYIPLCIAENALVWDLLRDKVRAPRDVPARVLGYDRMTGSDRFRRQLARFAGRTFLGRDVAPGQVAALAGAGTVLEILFHVLADPGDGVLVPTPSYAGFWQDLQTRDALTVIPVHGESSDGFRLTTDRLERALATAETPVRAVLLTSPDNPRGTVYRYEEIGAVLDWAESHRLHVVSDEVYALSVFGATPFVSAARLRATLGERLHIVWAFSKDFAASGLRCGVLISENRQVMAAVDALSYWACVSGDTQFLLGEMISDDRWIDRYLAEMRRRLADARARTAAALARAGVPALPSEAGFFVLCDLRGFLDDQTFAAETRLWRRLLDEANVNLTPGSACRIAEPGFMRLCFAGVPSSTLEVALERVAAVLRGEAPLRTG